MSTDKANTCQLSVAALRRWLQNASMMLNIYTRKALDNVLTLMLALGSCFNTVRHYLALC